MTHLKRQQLISSTQLTHVHGYNTKFLLYPRPRKKDGRHIGIFSSDFDLDQCLVFRMWFGFSLPNLVIIRRSMAGLWRHIDFTRWRP